MSDLFGSGKIERDVQTDAMMQQALDESLVILRDVASRVHAAAAGATAEVDALGNVVMQVSRPL